MNFGYTSFVMKTPVCFENCAIYKHNYICLLEKYVHVENQLRYIITFATLEVTLNFREQALFSILIKLNI